MLGLDRARQAAAEALMADLGLPLRAVRRLAARSGCPAARRAGCRWRSRWSATRASWSSTSRRSGRTARNYDGLLEILAGHLHAGATLIAATHDERFVADVADRVITMADGRITADERIR